MGSGLIISVMNIDIFLKREKVEPPHITLILLKLGGTL
jgi:hypothetical protein